MDFYIFCIGFKFGAIYIVFSGDISRKVRNYVFGIS